MNSKQLRYLLNNHKNKSIKQLAEELDLKPKEVQRELQRIESVSGFDSPSSVAPGFAPSPTASIKSLLLCSFLIIAAALIAYLPSFSVPFLLDDQPSIVQYYDLHRFSFAEIMKTSRPILYLSFALNYGLSRLNTWSYHAFNLTIHVSAALVLFGIVLRTLSVPRYQALHRDALKLALSIALIWCLHPLNTQAVTYIVQRSESMMAMFYLLTLYCTIRGSQSVKPAIWYAGAITACILGMGTKQIMMTAPLVILLYDRIFLSNSWSDIFRKRLYLYGTLVTICILLNGNVPTLLGIKSTDTYQSAGFAFKETRPLNYLLTQPAVILHYLKLAFIPYPLCFDYRWPIVQTIDGAIVPLLGTTILFVCSLLLLKKSPGFGFLALAFFMILGPTSSFIPIDDAAVEHRMYLPLAALAALTILAAYFLFKRLGRKKEPYLLWGLVLMISTLFGLMTFQRNKVYQDEKILWKNVLTVRPDNARAHDMLGITLAKQGETEQAIPHFKSALQLDDQYAQAHANLGVARAQQGSIKDALVHFREAVRLRPTSAEAHTSLGAALVRDGHPEEGILEYRRALELDPDFKGAHLNMGILLSAQGDHAEGLRHLRKVLELDPENQDAKELIAKYSELT